MTARLPLAIAVSLLLHLALLVAAMPEPPRPPRMEVRLKPIAPPEIPLDMLEPEIGKKVESIEHDTLSPLSPSKAEPTPPPPPPPPTAKAKPSRLSASQEQRALEKLATHLVYPEAAIAAGHEGTVLLLLKLAPDGTVLDASLAASSGHNSLDSAALAAVRRAGRLNTGGKTEFILPFTFRLQ